MMAAIGGIVVAVSLLSALCFAFFKRRCNRAIPTKHDEYKDVSATDDASDPGDNAIIPADLSMLRLDTTLLHAIEYVAEGAYGQVWRGTYQGNTVAIKGLLPGKSSHVAVAILADEILLASTMQSPYIVQLLGASWRIPSDLQMVLEWMDRGDLRSVLYKTAPSAPNEASASFSWDEKIDCMLSMVEGLVYLHSMNIIHRDLKSRNILLDLTKGTKLTDFGASREMSTETMTIGVGTCRWMAPEVLYDCYYSTAADVYSFGVVLSELSTHEIPYYNLRTDKGLLLLDTAIMGRVMTGAIAPTFGTSTPPWVLDLGKACIASSHESRPTAVQAAHIIRQHVPTRM